MMSDKRWKVLIVGAGSIGERHLRCFQATGRAEASLCETNVRLCNDVAQRYEVRRNYSDFEEALRDPHDAALLATPAHLHIPLAIRAAHAGLHLLIEKPLAANFDRVDELIELVEENRLVAGVAYVMLANPVLADMKSALASGRFGRPVELVAVSGQHFPTFRPAYREIYYRDRATGGGAIQDALTHTINAAEFLVGPIDRIVADAEHQVLDGVDVEDTVHVLARHGSLLASYSLNQHQAPNESTITVVCERGTIRLELHANRWRWMVEPGNSWNDVSFDNLDRDSIFTRQAHAFLDALEGRQPLLCSLREGAATLGVNLAILDSVRTNAWTKPTANESPVNTRDRQ